MCALTVVAASLIRNCEQKRRRNTGLFQRCDGSAWAKIFSDHHRLSQSLVMQSQFLPVEGGEGNTENHNAFLWSGQVRSGQGLAYPRTNPWGASHHPRMIRLTRSNRK